MFPNTFEKTATGLVSAYSYGSKVVHTLAAIGSFVERNDWQGACHATTAVAFVLLGAQGVWAEPCLGEVMLGDAAWDHSWIEIDGAVFDVVIARPLIPEAAQPPVVAGRSAQDGEPTDVQYGVVSGVPQLPEAAAISRMLLGEYMDGFPGHPQGLWGIAVEIGSELELRLDVAELRSRYARTRWTARPAKPVPSDDENRRARNARKRRRQGR